MKKLLIIVIIMTIVSAVYNVIQPDYIKMQNDFVKACEVDMTQNPDLICD